MPGLRRMVVVLKQKRGGSQIHSLSLSRCRLTTYCGPSTLSGAKDPALKVFAFLELTLKDRERQLPRKEIKSKISDNMFNAENKTR